jgi:hypothetical protein
MRLTISLLLPLVGLISPVAMADDLTVFLYCDSRCHAESGMWHSMLGQYAINAEAGCRYNGDTGIPYLEEICFDWINNRGHFYYQNGPKRCLQQWSSVEISLAHGALKRWKEVGCSW